MQFGDYNGPMEHLAVRNGLERIREEHFSEFIHKDSSCGMMSFQFLAFTASNTVTSRGDRYPLQRVVSGDLTIVDLQQRLCKVDKGPALTSIILTCCWRNILMLLNVEKPPTSGFFKLRMFHALCNPPSFACIFQPPAPLPGRSFLALQIQRAQPSLPSRCPLFV